MIKDDLPTASTRPRTTASVTGAMESATADLLIQPPAISLPKSGGALRGIGEKFSADAMTGTASLNVPVFTSPGRSSFGPRLALGYDSGAGNGPFGLGWSLGLPAITRKADKGLPQYQDDFESDVFILSGAEDLVPVLAHGSTDWKPQPTQRSLNGKLYTLRAYRPRVEGLFARIERWTNPTDPADVFWRSIAKDNVTTWYGLTSESRIADPADPAHIFSWLIARSYDDRGNLIEYDYKAEDSAGLDPVSMHERNRTAAGRTAARYPRAIRYGHRGAYFAQPDARDPVSPPADHAFEVIFDYGEYDIDTPVPGVEVRAWPLRPDPFSTCRPGFELRTYRRCQRVLMFHHFPDDDAVGTNCLVRATGCNYADGQAGDTDLFYSLLASVTQTGFRRDGAGYLARALPPLSMSYSVPAIDPTVRALDAQSVRNTPSGIDGTNYRFVDLDGDGLAGILSEQGGAWFYKANLSPANTTPSSGPSVTLAEFGPKNEVAALPSQAELAAGGQQLVSLSGDGALDLVAFDGPAPGFAERTADGGWSDWTSFESLPRLDWNSRNLRFIDLTGDGLPDLLIAGDKALCWHASLAGAGFTRARRVAQALDEERGPRLLFDDSTESIFLADMTGDGLTDLVRVRNGEVCYWPNLGYGRFGPKVSMEDAPWFDAPDLFNGRRIRLADLDGSGTADIVYFASRGTQLHFNLSGNGFAPPRLIDATPAADGLTNTQVIDLLGNGTSCIVWSSPSPAQAGTPLRWVDLMSSRKPHLLTGIDNNLGSETLVSYVPSTHFFVTDKLAGTPWLTRLPFPVQVVGQVELRDWIGRNRFVTRYAYHHGFFDGVEREFRGFGMVEQCDTGELGALDPVAAFPAPLNEDAASWLPPVRTCTWYHTGAYMAEAPVSRHFATEYYREPGLDDAQAAAMALPDTRLPTTILLPDGSRLPYTITPDEAREAARSLHGLVLRQEVYATDGSAAASRPYVVSENAQTIELLQPQGPNVHAVFHTHARETIEFQYERTLYHVGAQQLADPRVSHNLTLDVDAYGNVLLAASVAYGRRHADTALSADDQIAQATLFATTTRSTFTPPVASPDAWRTPLTAGTITHQLIRCTPQASLPDITNLFGFAELAALIAQAGDGGHDLPYEDVTAAGATAAHAYRRLIGRTRTLYLADDLSGPLPFGQPSTLALPFERYAQALTPGLVSAIYGPKLNGAQLNALLSGDAQYRDLDGDGNLWRPSGRSYYSPDPNAPDLVFARTHYFLVQSVRNPFGGLTTINHDADDLVVTATIDALNNTIAAQYDYRVLTPALVTDPNGNRTSASFDALGLVAGTAQMGKTTETLGDTLAGFLADLSQSQVDAYADAVDPASVAAALLGNAGTRVVSDLARFATTRAANPDDPTQWQPAFASVIARETHLSDLDPGKASALQIAFSYSDGFGREIQKKLQVERVTPGGAPRWIASGWTIFDNKGQPVCRYEPFFSALPSRAQKFEFGVAAGVSDIVLHDPLGRAVATVRPDHSWEKIVLDPWLSLASDGNDTVLMDDPRTDPDVGMWLARLPAADLLPTWYRQRIDGALGSAAQAAATATAGHAGTPARTAFDALGRAFLTIADNGAAGRYPTHSLLDVQGNVRGTIDELGRLAITTDFDMLGTRLHTASLDGGERWMLGDVGGHPLRAWDSRGHALRNEYDTLRRLVAQFVLGTDPASSDPRTLAGELQIGRIVYGEGVAGAASLNLLTRIVQEYDTAGVLTHRGVDPDTGTEVGYDFQGNLCATQRQFMLHYADLPDWAGATPLGPDSFLTVSRHDALNRPVRVNTPDASATLPGYDASGLLKTVDIRLRGNASVTPFVTDLAYNPRGQRTRITHGNGAQTRFEYDPLTFRLTQLITTRSGFPAGQAVVQQLSYVDDPVGNVTHVQDDADIQNVVYFRNRRVEPSADFRFDPLYRLVQASGREHLGQLGGGGLVPGPASYNDQPRVGLAHPGDGNAMGTYVEQYRYDDAGNLQQLQHVGSDPANPGWTRAYVYAEPSSLEPAKTGNRLSRTLLGPQGLAALTEDYAHDPHGNMTRMPQLQQMQWDFADHLRLVQRQAVDASDADGALHQGERTYFVCDAAGHRVRKVTERANGTLMKERIYLGLFERYREYDGAGTTVTLERETLHAMDDRRRLALVETRTQGEDDTPVQLVRYQYANRLGSACLELDDTGRVISYEEYTPFGSTSYQALNPGIRAAAKRYRFSGIERDDETGLNSQGPRYCAPWLGRWTSCDPAGMIDGPNLYRYARNAPTTLTDESGTDPQPPEQRPPSDPTPKNGAKAAKADDDPPRDPPQAQAQNSGFSNSALIQPPGFKTSEFTLQGLGSGGSPGTSGAGNFLYHYRQVTAPGREFGLQAGFGGATGADGSAIGTGTLVGTLHLGQEASEDVSKTRQWLTGWYFGAGLIWGQNPTVTNTFTDTSPAQVGGPNPTAFAQFALSNIHSEVQGRSDPHLHPTSESDFNMGLQVQRFGAVNGVTVGGLLQPSLYFNHAWNDKPADNWSINLELGVTGNLGAGGVKADPGSPTPVSGAGVGGVPYSVTGTAGLGFSKTWGDYAIALEPYVQHEAFSNVATTGSTGRFESGAWTGGLKLDFTAINQPANR